VALAQDPDAAAPRAGGGRRPLGPSARAALAAALAALAAAVFWPSREHAFLNYDDDLCVTRSSGLALGLGLDGLRWAATSVEAANWFPLTRLSWLVDHALFGLDPRAFHTTNLCLHALATALLFLALARMTGAAWRSAFAAAVFAVHPLHVEPVAWIASRKDPLSAVCFGAALLVAAGARGRPQTRGERAGVFAALALGLMAKPTLVTLPFLLLLLDFWPLARLARSGDARRIDPRALRRSLLEKAPLVALVALESAVVLLAQRAGGAMVGLDQLPLGARVANAFAAYAGYLRRAILPSDLAVFYPHPVAPDLAAAGLGLAAVVALTTGAVLARRREPALLVGWLWFAGLLVPTLGLVQVGAQALADRYAYLPLTGLAIAVAWGAPALLAAAGVSARARRTALWTAGLASVAALALASRAQLAHWRDSEALFRHALAVTRDNPVARAHLGDALLARGVAADAAAHWEQALRLAPDDLTVVNNLAWLRATSGDPAVADPERALALAERALALVGGPRRTRDPRLERAAVLDTLAAAQARAGRSEEAARTAGRAAELAARAGDAALAAEIRARLSLYAARRPYLER